MSSYKIYVITLQNWPHVMYTYNKYLITILSTQLPILGTQLPY